MKLVLQLAATHLKADRRLFVPFVNSKCFLMAIHLNLSNADSSSDVLFRQFGQAAGQTLFTFGDLTTDNFSDFLNLVAQHFLRKQRIRQLGLVHNFGFGQRELRQMMATEKLLSLLNTLLCGGILGTVLTRLRVHSLAQMLHVQLHLDFGLSTTAYCIAGLNSIGLYFVLMLVDEFWSLRQHPIELVRETNAGEREQ